MAPNNPQSPKPPAPGTGPAAKPSVGAGPKSPPGRPAKPAPGPQNQMLTIEEVAQVLGVSLAEAQRLAQRGGLPGTRVSGQWLCPRPMLEKWQKDQQARKVAGPPKFLDERPDMTSTESYDLSIIDELDLPDL